VLLSKRQNSRRTRLDPRMDRHILPRKIGSLQRSAGPLVVDLADFAQSLATTSKGRRAAQATSL